MNKIIKIILIIFIILVIVIGGGAIYLLSGMSDVKEVEVKEIDLSSVGDGVYRGTFDQGRWKNVVEVTVKDHRITDIKIIDDVTFVQEGLSDKIFSLVISKQNTNIEIVSGATATSKAYLKAIEDAFSK